MMGENIRSASGILRTKYGGLSRFKEQFAQQQINAEIAEVLRDARRDSGLSLTELADMVGTTQVLIARIEEDNCQGQLPDITKKVAAALGKTLTTRFFPKEITLS
jgi:ribosome-binding protein aMBF1 (putative translation factor)